MNSYLHPSIESKGKLGWISDTATTKRIKDSDARTEPRLPVLVAVDVDPDWRLAGRRSVPYRGDLGWDGIRQGIPRLLEALGRSSTPELKDIRFTWLLRSDLQMAELFSDPAYVAGEFAEFWKARAELGDELGWHPHFWRFSENKRLWYHETRDVDWIRDCLREGHTALSRHFRINVAKTGWTFHTNATMKAFSDLGVQADLSALPGMRYSGFVPGTDLPLGAYDWSRSPQEPYHPREDDYQKPGLARALPILEIPNWTFPVERIRALGRSRRQRPRRDFANPAKHPMLMHRGFRRPPMTVPFLCYFHPEELTDRTKLFSGRNVERNLATLVQTLRSRGMRPRMEVPTNVVAEWRNSA